MVCPSAARELTVTLGKFQFVVQGWAQRNNRGSREIYRNTGPRSSPGGVCCSFHWMGVKSLSLESVLRSVEYLSSIFDPTDRPMTKPKF